LSIKYFCKRCGKRCRWWQKVAVDEDIYRIPQDDGIAIYKHRKIIHWKCLSKLEQKKIEYDNSKRDDDTTNLGLIRKDS
jgi:hypothetical protein